HRSMAPIVKIYTCFRIAGFLAGLSGVHQSDTHIVDSICSHVNRWIRIFGKILEQPVSSEREDSLRSLTCQQVLPMMSKKGLPREAPCPINHLHSRNAYGRYERQLDCLSTLWRSVPD